MILSVVEVVDGYMRSFLYIDPKKFFGRGSPASLLMLCTTFRFTSPPIISQRKDDQKCNASYNRGRTEWVGMCKTIYPIDSICIAVIPRSSMLVFDILENKGRGIIIQLTYICR